MAKHPATDEITSIHRGHNTATHSLLTGIAHHLQGDGMFGQVRANLGMFIPQFISLGTMGLVNQLEDEEGLPDGIGYRSFRRWNIQAERWDNFRASELTGEQRDFLGIADDNRIISTEEEEALRFRDFVEQTPGFGADGYDLNQNNNRTSTTTGWIMAGLGPPFSMRGQVGAPVVGQLPPPPPRPCPRCGEFCTCGCCIDPNTWGTQIEPDLNLYDTVRCELISSTHPRQQISFRNIIPEEQSELPRTVEVILSAMVSTGALAQFRRPGQSFLFITEAGLWSRPDWIMSGNNGMLAGYRLLAPNRENWMIWPDHSIHMQRWYSSNGIGISETPTESQRMQAIAFARTQITQEDFERARDNRRRIKQSVLRVGVNQVVQVIWKIQLGGIEQLFPGVFCPDCQREFVPGGSESQTNPQMCPFCCELDAGDLDLLPGQFCPRVCDIEGGIWDPFTGSFGLMTDPGQGTPIPPSMIHPRPNGPRLSGITIVGQSLLPNFDPELAFYRVVVTHNIDEVNIAAETLDIDVEISINNIEVDDMFVSLQPEGNETIITIVVSRSETDFTTYLVRVERDPLP